MFSRHKERTPQRHLLLKAFLVSMTLPLLGSSLFAQQEAKPKNVLVLASYNPSAPVGLMWERGIRSVFKAEPSYGIHLNFEYLELIRFDDDRYVRLLLDLLRHKYSTSKPDLIIPVYSGALGFVLDQGSDLFPDVPVVFGGVERQFAEGRTLGPNITGILSVNSYRETLDLALNLHPGTRHVAIVAGADIIGRESIMAAREAYRPQEKNIEFMDFSGLPMPAILQKVASLPPRTIVIYITLLEDGDGEKFTAPESLSQISRASNAPVYSFWDLVLGHGMVGGYLSSAEEKGREVAELGLRILAGEKPAAISLTPESRLKYKFDWRQLKRWSISEDQLPSGSIVKFKELSIWDRYKGRIIGVIALIVFQALIISFLLQQRRKRRSAEVEIEERLQFEELVTEISAKFVNLNPVNFASEIGASLKQISDTLGFDRSSIFEYSMDRTQLSVVSYHAREGIQPPPVMLSMDQFTWISAKTFQGESVLFCDPADLGDGAEPERQYFQQEGLRGGIILPLAVSGATLGLVAFMVFHAPKPWPQAIVKRLQVIAEIFANAMMRKQNEEKLLDKERKFRTVADYTYDWEYWENADGSLQYVSPSCERISGYAAHEFLEDSSLLRDIILPEDRDKWDKHHLESLDGLGSRELQIRIQRKDGQIRWIEHAGQPVRDAQGLSLGYRASNRDITERKNHEFEVQNRLEFEGFIAGLSSQFINLPTDRLDSEIIVGLSRIGTFMGVDRSFLFQFNWNRTEFRISHLWEADGIRKDQVVRGVILKDHFPWLANNLTLGRDIVISDVKELPAE